MEKKFLVYFAKNTVNGKYYVGKTHNLEVRKDIHKKAAIRGDDNCTKFYRAIRKYGFDNFEWQIIENGLIEALAYEKEKYYIKAYNSFKEGYNGNEGGRGVPSKTRAMRNKISRNNKKKSKIGLLNLGKRQKNDVRLKISDSLTGKKLSQKTKDRLSEAHSGKRNIFFGQKQDLYSLVLMSNSKRKYPKDITDSILALYKSGLSYKEIEDRTKVPYGYIVRVIKNPPLYVLYDIGELERTRSFRKLNSQDCAIILLMNKNMISYKNIAVKFGVTQRTIARGINKEAPYHDL